MGTTSNRSYPYPAGSDAVDVPGDLESLVDAVDADVAAIIAGTGLADGAVTDAKLAVPKVDQSVVGNLLTANVSTGTDTLGATTGFDIGNAGGGTLASSTTLAFQGSRSLALTYGSMVNAFVRVAGGNGYSSAAAIPVTAGQTYTFSYYARSTSQTGSYFARVYWWKANGTAASTALNTSATVSITDSAWSQVSITAVAPADAAFASAISGNTGNSAFSSGETVYTDAYTFHQGAGGLWAPPGTPIANLGTYTDESVGRRIFTWDAVNARWQMTYGDTGWRDVTPENGWAATVLRIRRVGNSCHLAVFGLDGTSATAEKFYTLPADFAPQWMVRAAMSASAADTFYTMQVASGSVDVDDAVTAGRMQHSWLTDASWPTSLPGSASGSIPS